MTKELIQERVIKIGIWVFVVGIKQQQDHTQKVLMASVRISITVLSIIRLWL
jgi:hypothetical protein